MIGVCLVQPLQGLYSRQIRPSYDASWCWRCIRIWDIGLSWSWGPYFEFQCIVMKHAHIDVHEYVRKKFALLLILGVYSIERIGQCINNVLCPQCTRYSTKNICSILQVFFPQLVIFGDIHVTPPSSTLRSFPVPKHLEQNPISPVAPSPPHLLHITP